MLPAPFASISLADLDRYGAMVTPRQREALRRRLAGEPYRSIGAALGISRGGAYSLVVQGCRTILYYRRRDAAASPPP